MSESKPKDKSFEISKRVVWEAYEKVKANQGAAGVDERVDRRVGAGPEREPLQALESDVLGDVLPRRGSVGVEIPKAAGKGVRVLGVPTVSDRIAQTVVRSYLEPEVEPGLHPDSYGYRPGRSAARRGGDMLIIPPAERTLTHSCCLV